MSGGVPYEEIWETAIRDSWAWFEEHLGRTPCSYDVQMWIDGYVPRVNACQTHPARTCPMTLSSGAPCKGELGPSGIDGFDQCGRCGTWVQGVQKPATGNAIERGPRGTAWEPLLANDPELGL